MQVAPAPWDPLGSGVTFLSCTVMRMHDEKGIDDKVLASA
jgi:hypothetical protein